MTTAASIFTPAPATPLTQDPPEAVARTLSEQGVDIGQLALCTNSDIDRLGRYRPQWLVATQERVLIIAQDQPAQLLVDLHFKDVSEFRCEGAIGSGLLQARVGGVYVDLIRYSNRLADRFEKVARKLDRALHGEKIAVYPDEQRDKREDEPTHVPKAQVLTRMLGLMRPYRTAAAGMMGLLLLGIGLDMVGPQLTRYLVDSVLPGNQQLALHLSSQPNLLHKHIQMLLVIVLVLVTVQILRMGVNICNGLLSTRVGTAITADMRGRLVGHLEQLAVAYYDRQQVGSLVGRVAYDTEALHGFVNQFAGGFVFQVLMVVGVGLMMFSINVKLALYTLVPAPLVIAGSIVFWRYIYPRYYRYWDASSKQAGMLSGMLSGIRVVKAFHQEDHELDRFQNASGYLRHRRVGVDSGVATFNPIMSLVFQFGGWIVWFIGGRDVLQGQVTLGELMAFFGYLAMFYGPLATLTQFTNWLTQFLTQAHRIFEVLDTPVQIAESAQATHVPAMKGDVIFASVRFGYNRHNPVLRDVSFHVPAGQMIGVVGRSGAGKSTVVNLICRFYDVDEGQVLIDGVDVRQWSVGDLRRQVGVVLQEPFLFRGSLWDNVTYGKTAATPEEVITAAKAGNCHDFILRSPHGYDTWVGERGAGLSGGERQRISIARVLLTDPRLLILDEATSSVDAESEAAIQEALAEVVKGRTTIAIAHRLSTLRSAKRILVVDDGRIAESGTHDELVARQGLYAKLVRIQGQMAPPTVDSLSRAARKQDAAGPGDVDAADHDGALPPLHSHRIRWLTPDNARIHLGNHGALHVTVVGERIYAGAFALRCLPVRYPGQYISLRSLDADKRERELGIIRELDQWPAEARRLISESLLQRYFVHTIQRVHNIELYNIYLKFTVDTDLGPAQFYMRWQNDRAQDFGTNGKMLLDTDENRYRIHDIDELPPADRNLFRRYIYW